MLRSFVTAILLVFAISPTIANAEPGTAPQKVSKPAAVERGHGVVLVSVRSSIFLVDKLNVYFLREGGDIDNDADVIRFSRKQGFLAVGNDTTDYLVKAFQLPPGRYRLVAHGSNCPVVPKPTQTCGASVKVAGETVARASQPSRGYAGETPAFEVQASRVTNAGDFALTAVNKIAWSKVPPKALEKMAKRFRAFEQGPNPQVPLSYHLTIPLQRRTAEQDIGRVY
ncbi:MAG: hypothetical protein AAF687_13090 [Pseudomonadota bacterium]